MGKVKDNGQKDRLLTWLLSGKHIDRFTALIELGIFELSARIVELEQEGIIVDRERKPVINRWNEKVSVMDYWMEV